MKAGAMKAGTRKPILVILGPTATGKSALGMEMARRLAEETPADGEIVNADALQVYRGFDIGTAKPSLVDQRAVPHHLIDILEPTEKFSAGEFARRATAAITDIQGRGRVAIVVGGSGLYLRALLEGLSPIPPGDEEVRQRLEERLADEGLAGLHEELRQRDPTTAQRLPPGDKQRILRALEVVLASGRPLSEWIRERPFGTRQIPALRIGLTLPRAILYDRVAGRVRDMITQGWLDEVAAMLAQGIGADVPAFQAIGYRQLVRHLGGQMSLEEAIDDIVRSTRRYAKRQMTWFRKEGKIRWIPAQATGSDIPSLMQEFKLLEDFFVDEQT